MSNPSGINTDALVLTYADHLIRGCLNAEQPRETLVILQASVILVDTNVPLDLADDKDHALDALEVVRRRLKPGRILVTPNGFPGVGISRRGR